MREIILALHDALSMIKYFTAGYSTETYLDGKIIVDYKGKRYVLKLEEIEEPSKDMFQDIKKLKYM